MARTTPYKNKDGKIISYQIRVFRGKDENGRELKPFSTNWKIPDTYKTESAIQNGLRKAVSNFELECLGGTVVNNKQTFKEYSNYFMKLCLRDKKNTTYTNYLNLLDNIIPEIGHLKLSKITVFHLNRMYIKLQEKGARKDQKYFDKNLQIKDIITKKNVKRVDLHKKTGLAVNTITLACQGKPVVKKTADLISNVLGYETNRLFSESPNKIGLSEKSIMHHHKLIHAILALAVKEELLKQNVASIASPPSVPRHRAEFFEIEEILTLKIALDNEPLKWKVFVYLLIDTGARRGEILGIKWSSINFENNTIHFDNNSLYRPNRGIYSDTPKGEEFRTLSIAKLVMNLLFQFKEKQIKNINLGIEKENNNDYVFRQADGRAMHPDSPNKYLNRFSNEHNLPKIYPHKFRHSHASILFSLDVDIVTIASRLGHKDKNTSMNIYGHLLNQSDRIAADAVANILYQSQESNDFTK